MKKPSGSMSRRALATASASLLAAIHAQAQTVWIGSTAGTATTDNDWSVAANWNPADIPNTNTEVASFNASQTNILAAPWLRRIDSATATINGLVFSSGVTNFNGNSGNTANVNFSANEAFRIDSGTLTLAGTTPYIAQNGAGQIYINRIDMTANAGLTLGGDGAGQVQIGTLTGATGTVTKSGNSTYLLALATTTTGLKYNITGGQLRFSNSSLAPNSLVTDFITINGGRLQDVNSNQTISANSGILLGSASGSGTGAISTVRNGNDQLSINGVIADNGAGADNLHLLGAGGRGRIALNGANTYTGSTTVENVILGLSYASSTAGRLSDTAALRLEGGRVLLSTNALKSYTTAATETVGGLTLGNGLNTILGVNPSGTSGTTGNSTNQITGVTNASSYFAVGDAIGGGNIPTGATVAAISGTTITLSVNTNATGSGTPSLVNLSPLATTTLDVGAITRTDAGLLGFQRSSTNYVLKTSTPNAYTGNSGAILGGWATVSTVAALDGISAYSPTDWASVDGSGNIIALAAYDSNSLTANANTRIDATQTLSGNVAINSLTGAVNNQHLQMNAGATLTINSGGVLWQAPSGNGMNIGTVAGQGTLTSGNGKDLIFWNPSPGTPTVNAVIADNGSTPIGITMSGASSQVLQLAANNTFTGAVNIFGGILQIGTAANADVGDGSVINIGRAGVGLSVGAAQLRFVNGQLGDKTLAQNINVRNLHANTSAAIRTGSGSFGSPGFDLNLDGNITVDTIDTAVDAPQIYLLEHSSNLNSSVRIGGATPNAKTLSGSTVTNQNTLVQISVNGVGFQNNKLFNGVTDLSDALIINSSIQDGSGGGGVSLLFERPNARGSLGLVALNGSNTYSGAGAGNSGSQSGTTLANTLVLAGGNTALGSGPVTLGRLTGGVPSNSKQGVLTNGAYTIANNIGLNTLSMGGGSATNGLTTYESWVGGNTANTSNFTGRIDWMTPSGVTPTFAGYTSGTVASNHALVLSQVAGGRSNFTGVIASNAASSAVADAALSPVIVASGGDVSLSNANNSYVGQTIVRNGSLLVGANAPSGAIGALGNATSAVQLGDVRNAAAIVSVKAASTGILAGTVTFNPTAGTNGNGLLTWTAGFNTSDIWDGQTVAANDYVLIKDQSGATGGTTVTNPAINGIYKVLNIGASTAQLERVASADSAYGTYVNVTAGDTWGGQRFYQGYGGTGTAVTVNNTPQAWMLDDTSYNAALLTDGAVAIGRAVNVNAGSGTRTLGGATNHNSSFTGAITLGKDAAFTSVATGGNRTTFGGVISGAGAVSKSGVGTVEFTAANDYSGGTTISAGLLLANNASGSATGTGSVTVSGGTLGGSGFIGGATTIQAGGTLAPGNSPGLITFANGLALQGATTMEVAGLARGTQYDGVDLTGGALAYGGTMSATVASAFLTGNTTFELFNFTGSQSGTFSSISVSGAYLATLNSGNGYSALDGAGNTWSFSHASGDLSFTLATVPEPSAFAALAGLGALGFASARRRRRA